MSEFVTLSNDFNEPNYNFWNDNSQISIVRPFNQLYSRDNTKNKSHSSKEMVVIFFMCEPDPEKNKFYRIAPTERLEMLKDTYFKEFDETDPVIVDCINSYPHICLSPIEKALKEEIDSMVKRQQFISSFDYTKASIDEIKSLDQIRSKTMSLYENYERLENKFIKQKTEARVRGGRRRSVSERKLL